MHKKVLVIFVLLLAAHASVVKADEISELKELILEQSKMIHQLQERIEKLEERQRLKDQSLAKRIEEVAEKKKETPALPDTLKWVEKVKISGDLRFRHEHIDTETSGSVRWKKGRDRQRIRARLMLEAIINDDWDVAFRLASGERSILVDEDDMFADPVSSNQTLKQNFSGKDIWLDLAYFNWHPAAREGLNVYGGKIKNPFYTVGKNQLVWDSDLNPEGIAATYAIPFGKKNTLHITGGGFWVDESSSGVDNSLWGIQGYIKRTIGNPDYILAGISYWDYGNIKGKTDTYGILAGNTADSTGGKWASDYDIIEFFGEYGTKFSNMPVAVFGNWVRNTVAISGEDTGWLVGGKLNKAKDPGSWEFSYDYRDLEADAVLGAFTDSDFIGGGTDGEGHRFNFTYQLARNLQAALTYFHNEKRSSGRDYDYRRLQADLLLKF